MSVIFGEVLTFGQRVGGDVELRVFGDEHYARYETLDGYTAVYDADRGGFCYARLAGELFRSTGRSVTEAPPGGLARHIQESGRAAIAKSEARRTRRTANSGGRDPNAVNRTFGPHQGLLEGRVLSIGTVRGLTILVNFQDITSTVTRADVEDMLNGQNYTRNGNVCSAREYFETVSSGRLHYSNTVVGPYLLSRDRQFYVDNLLVEEALALAVADGLDLTEFDSRGDGVIDALNVLYAGQTQYNGELWPHNSSIDLQHGGIRTDLYLLTSLGRTPADLTIGTFCHENGHLLCRFPDMYDYGKRDGDTSPSAGIGTYCLMGSGNHLDFGRSPSPVCAYLRDLAGWCDTEIDLSVSQQYEAPHADYATVMKYRTSKPNEYFVVENRSKLGLDRGAAGSGLAVYHCDTLGSNEWQQGTEAKHYQCALLQADGRNDLELDKNQGDGSDLFGQVDGTALSADSSPHTREWDGRDSGLVLADIGAAGSVMSFATGAAPAPSRTVLADSDPVAKVSSDGTRAARSGLRVDDGGIAQRVKVTVDLTGSETADLRLTLTSPTGRRSVLHAPVARALAPVPGEFDSSVPGTLSDVVGQPMKGTWTLSVEGGSSGGALRGWTLELETAPMP